MGVSLVVAVTDLEWVQTLREQPHLQEVNFWAPSGVAFRALVPGELFLFKLHAPHDRIVGGGVFAHATTLPCSLAWESFREANGARSERAMRQRIAKYRRADPADRSDFQIGCRILTQPFFLRSDQSIAVPASWSRNIVSLKRYSTDEPEGLALWNTALGLATIAEKTVSEPVPRYGAPQLVQPRLGQGAFRAVVTDAYRRRCAVTGERTLPALEAAHITPYGEGGSHELNNGLLLRRDLHSLFDSGYVTVSPECRLEVSRRIKEEFDNGRHYYALHGQTLVLPERIADRPDRAALTWHNENRYRG